MLLELRVAREWRVPPTKLRREWSDRDRALGAALLAHEASMGPCGFSHHITTAPGYDGDGWFKVATVAHCPACQARDEWMRESDGDERDPGDVVRIVNTRDEPQYD